MKIAQVAPLYESVPPGNYGGTERIVSYITEELVGLGHEVTLFASADSVTTANLVPICDNALRQKGVRDPLAYHVLMAETVFKHASNFDLVHNHIDYLLFPLARRYPTLPVLTTLHGRLDDPELGYLHDEYQDMPLVSISDAQRAPLKHSNWMGTVYHGLPLDLYRPAPGDGGYLAFVGRISPEKKVESAIAIATAAGIPLKIAAKVDAVDREYFECRIKPLLDHPLIEFAGEVDQGQKQELIGRAMALVFPVDWPEPFGLVMIEAMACGTPVLARRRGSVPEVIEHGVSGFLFENDSDAISLIQRIGELDRAACRKCFEQRFSVERMVQDYMQIYSRLNRVNGKPARHRVTRRSWARRSHARNHAGQ